jgi:putative endonuclease
MSYYVYILFAEKFDKFYIGQTNDISNRLKRHNNGTEKATRPFIPWDMVWFTSKDTRSEAMILEKKLKNLSKIRIRSFIEKYS